MDRISRRMTNLKQNKISVSKIQPTLQTLREGEEILYQPKNKSLRRYRREGHILWYTSMIRDGNLIVDKNLTVKNNLTVSGNIIGDVIWNTSDLNLKTDISSISDALSKINSIRGVNFKWKKYKPDGESPNPDRDRNRIGCIAQEVNEVLPEAVDSVKDGEWRASYTTLIPLLIEAVKELSAEVDILKNQ